MKHSNASENDWRPETTTPCRRCGEGMTLVLENGRTYLENFSRPPFRAPKTHEINERALKHLGGVFETTKLGELTADDIEAYLRRRLKQRVVVKTGNDFVEKGALKATTVHQELRVLRRVLNVAVRKKLLFANPCAGVEFPARVDGLFRPHYMAWSEQQKIEFAAPEYLRNLIRIITETGLRIYKELARMKKEQVDLETGRYGSRIRRQRTESRKFRSPK
jgi:site-specific recombinase XerD